MQLILSCQQVNTAHKFIWNDMKLSCDKKHIKPYKNIVNIQKIVFSVKKFHNIENIFEALVPQMMFLV